MTKNEKNIYKDIIYDYNIYLESELLNMYIKKNPHKKNDIIYNKEPTYLNIKNIQITVLKKLNKYEHTKNIIQEKNYFTIEPVFVKNPPLLETYYNLKNINFKKIKLEKDSLNENLKMYSKLEKSNIFNIRLNSLDIDDFNFLK